MKSSPSLLLILLMMFVVTSLSAQGLTDTIYIKKRSFYQQGHQLNRSELMSIMRSNQDAYVFMKKAKASSTAASAVFIAGAGVVLGGLLVKEVNTKLIICGAGLGIELIAVLISTGYKPNVKKAVSIYNDEIRKKYAPISLKVGAGLTPEGAGIIIHFK
jgi:hypothetical protein